MMTLDSAFLKFFSAIEIKNLDKIKATVREITKTLNSAYYALEQDESSHCLIVGSLGRKTAIQSVSDIDIIFDLPAELFSQYDSHETNGQSNLLQDVKKKLIHRYPRTEFKGDGQVVVIEFDAYTIELVPAFKQSDDTFKHPDSNNGGSWKITNPLAEINACAICEAENKGLFFHFCQLLRSWRNIIDFEFGGLLIDTFVAKHLSENNIDKGLDYYSFLKSLFSYLTKQDPNQSYWHAIGSNQQVFNKSNGAFVKKAEQALKVLIDAEKDPKQLFNVLRELLGPHFPKYEEDMCTESEGSQSTEEFIEDKFNIHIQYSLSIDCSVSCQSSHQSFLLSSYLRIGRPLEYSQTLNFHITSTDCPKPYQVFWKVRNVGSEAIKRNKIRGQIEEGKSNHEVRASVKMAR